MPPLLRLVLSRLVQGAALLLALSFLLFGVMAHLPGDPVDLLVASNPSLSPADVARLKKLRGLDQPFPVRWWRWLYGNHEAKAPPSTLELPAVVGVLPAPRPFVVDVTLPAHDGLTVTAVPPLALDPEGAHAKALIVEAGARRLYVVVKDANQQEALWSVPVYVAPPRAEVLHRVGDDSDEDGDEGGVVVVGDDPERSSPERDIDDRSGTQLRAEATGKRALDDVPAAVDRAGVVGQHVVVDGEHVSVDNGDPFIDEDRFTGGVVFGELGWSFATKRPVKELLFGEDVVCGDNVVGPGESCDDGNVIDDDGCSRDCFEEVQTLTSIAWLDTVVAGAVTGQGRIGNTLVLTLPSLLLAMVLALVSGTAAALRKDRLVDVVVRAGAAVCGSVPAFFVALVFITIFAEQLQVLPSGGMQAPGIHREGATAAIADRVAHLVLPMAVLVIFWSGRFVRQVRSAVLAAQDADFVRSARARGRSSSSVLLRHILPNAALPLITLVGLSLPTLFGGALLTETVFAWPGMGRLQYDAILQNDSYVAVVVFLGSAALVIAGSLVADLAVFALDPRMRR